MPLISELLRIKVQDSRDSLIQALVPIIDKIVTLKAEQNLNEISLALADVIAPAIQAEINKNPRVIGKAIGPEIALAIQEQIQIDAEAISNILAPQISPAIKKQILLEKDAMIDALYPVIGNTIAKYLGEVIKDINNRVENSLSIAGVKRKIKAKIEGVSEAELIFKESIKFTVQAVFLIHKTSGLVIKEVQTSSEHQLDSNMLAGMLTAIRSFANDCISESGDFSELAEIEYGESKIILEAAGYCYLALIIKGEPSQQFISKIRDTLSNIILHYGQIIRDFDGDPAPIPQSIEFLLANLIETEKKEDKSGFPSSLVIAICVILSLVFVPLGIFKYQQLKANKIESTIANALDATPELSIYRIKPIFRKNTLTLNGKVPNQYLRNKAETISNILKPELSINNQIIAINIPPDPVLAAQEVERVTQILNQQNGVDIITNYENKNVTITGIAPDQAESEKISFSFEQIPGVSSVINTLQTKIPQIPVRVYFDLNDNKLSDTKSKINQVKDFLLDNPQLNVRIIGHSDTLGTLSERKEIAQKRAMTIKDTLVKVGIPQSRLVIYASTEFPPGVTKEQPLELSRCVRFETFK